MSKNKNYHKRPVVAKDRFVGVRLDKESFSKIEEAAMAADLVHFRVYPKSIDTKEDHDQGRNRR